jgi:ribosomal protein S18
MRSNLLTLTEQRDQAIQAGQESQRKLALCHDELNQSKTKFAKLQHEKTILERDQRMTLSLATASQSAADDGLSRHHASDMDYYKRKVCLYEYISDPSRNVPRDSCDWDCRAQLSSLSTRFNILSSLFLTFCLYIAVV